MLEVRDEFCPWNQARWHVAAARSIGTTAEADLRLDVSELGSVYLGGFTFASSRGRAKSKS